MNKFKANEQLVQNYLKKEKFSEVFKKKLQNLKKRFDKPVENSVSARKKNEENKINKKLEENNQKKPPKQLNFKLPDIKTRFNNKINCSVDTNFYDSIKNNSRSVYYVGNKKGRFLNKPPSKGDNIGKRYEVKNKINQGAFGCVISCFDHKKKENVAVKCPLKREYNELIQFEKKVYKQIGGNNNNVLYIKNYVKDPENNQDYLVMEKLGMNLYEWIKSYQPTFNEILNITNQIFAGVNYIHNKGIIHTDLKSENIVFVNNNCKNIKIVDLGNGIKEREINYYSTLQTLYFRSPEVILHNHKTRMMDIWSIGCIICELVNRGPVFVGTNDKDQLYAYMEYLGRPPVNFIKNSPKKFRLFDYNLNPLIIPHRQINSKNLSSIIHHKKLLEIVNKCLRWIPKERI